MNKQLYSRSEKLQGKHLQPAEQERAQDVVQLRQNLLPLFGQELVVRGKVEPALSKLF